MLHYERKLPAFTVFELLSFKFYEKGGAFQKSPKIDEKFLQDKDTINRCNTLWEFHAYNHQTVCKSDDK